MSDSSNRTEQPSPRRLERARKEGNFVSSRELVSAAQFLVFAGLLLYCFESFFADCIAGMRGLLRSAFAGVDFGSDGLIALFRYRIAPGAASLIVYGLAMSGAAIAAQMAASQFGIAPGKLAPDLRRLNPFSRLKDMGSHNVGQFLRSLVFLPLFLGIAGWLVWTQAADLLALSLRHWWMGVASVATSLKDLIERSIYLFLALGLFDWMRQHQKYMSKMRMTKQEVRDEHKEVEGNPQIKAKVRRLQRDMSRRRMMSEVPKASAVIVNPTHYAVALQYDQATMDAPKLVAKGIFDADDLRAFSDSYSKPLDHENMRENELISQMQDQMEATLAQLMHFLADKGHD